jgi:23S rRNA maturation mini-RNase III
MQSRENRDLAWIGDAVLALYARQWLLAQPPHPLFTRQQLFIRLTSNAFLQSMGEPTAVEARIGVVYKEKGLQEAFDYIEDNLQPLFEKHLANVARGQRGRKGPVSPR